MAFVKQNLDKWNVGADTAVSVTYLYTSATDNKATIIANAYFDSMLVGYGLSIGDLLWVVASDAQFFLKVTQATTEVQTSVAVMPAGSIDLAMLSAGITPSHVIKFAGKESNGGGAATVAITVTGVADTDVVFAQLEASTNAVTVQKVTPTANTITVLFSGDPGASTIISYQAMNAAA